MMKHNLLVFLFLVSTVAARAQAIAPTTEDEYAIATVGYRMFLSMKVELKPGYTISDYSVFEYGDRKAEFKGLFRKGETKPCAILMIYQNLRGAPEYYCIPTPDAPEVLWDRYRNSIKGDTDVKQEQLQFFGFALARAVMYFVAK